MALGGARLEMRSTARPNRYAGGQRDCHGDIAAQFGLLQNGFGATHSRRYTLDMPTPARVEVDTDLMLLLGQASHALATEMTAGLVGVGISPRAHCVLTHALSGELTQSDLAEACGLDKTTMVVTLDELERAGLARRQLSSTDRRARIVSVTAAGRRKVAQADTIVARIYADVLSALPAGERQAFTSALRRLVADRLSTPVQCTPVVRRRRAPRAS
jgi:MarR family transcriptional regulator for hemolysin